MAIKTHIQPMEQPNIFSFSTDVMFISFIVSCMQTDVYALHFLLAYKSDNIVCSVYTILLEFILSVVFVLSKYSFVNTSQWNINTAQGSESII